MFPCDSFSILGKSANAAEGAALLSPPQGGAAGALGTRPGFGDARVHG